jgi:hypothetical protein
MRKPNFLVFMTVDQCYGNLSCMGAADFKPLNLKDEFPEIAADMQAAAEAWRTGIEAECEKAALTCRTKKLRQVLCFMVDGTLDWG